MTTSVNILLDNTTSILDNKEKYDNTKLGVNTYLTEMRDQPDITCTLVTFAKDGYSRDSLRMDKVAVDKPIREIELLTGTYHKDVVQDGNYRPHGSTPLIESSILFIEAIAERQKTKPTDKIVVVTMTDGEENASDRTKYTNPRLNALIAAKKELGWQFLFLGASHDQYAQAAMMGLSKGQTMSYDAQSAASTQSAYAGVARQTKLYASGVVQDCAFDDDLKEASGDQFNPSGGSGGYKPSPSQPQQQADTSTFTLEEDKARFSL